MPGPVPLCGSSKVWIQVVDKPGDNDDHLWQYGYILGAKLFNSPAMSTVKIDPTYSSKSQQALDKAATDGSSASTASICGSVIPVRIGQPSFFLSRAHIIHSHHLLS